MRRRCLWAIPLSLAALMVVPAVAGADTLEAYGNGVLKDSVAINTMWVVITAVLVLLMQAGFAMLEIGFSRTKNAGTGSGEDPDEPLDRGHLLLGGGLCACVRHRHAARET